MPLVMGICTLKKRIGFMLSNLEKIKSDLLMSLTVCVSCISKIPKFHVFYDFFMFDFEVIFNVHSV